MKQKCFLLVLGTLFTIIACQKKDEDKVYQYQTLNLPENAFDYKAGFSAAFTQSGTSTVPLLLNIADDNKITNAGATLGRVLFYDKLLSENNTTACGSCHHQAAGFSDGGKSFSIGFEGKATPRNSMAIVNTADNGIYFWDGRSKTLEDLALQPVRNHIEMGLDKISDLETKLSKTAYYTALFEKAFGTKEITRQKVSKALSQFINSLVSRNSRFDEGLKNNFDNFSPSEKRGEVLFSKTLYCGKCHNGKDLDGVGLSAGWNSPATLNISSANVGLEKEYSDNGIGAIESLNAINNGKFKVPSLRNVALTAPYMHDGRFTTLEQVIDHYSNGVADHPNLDSRIRFFNRQTNWNGGGVDTTNNRHIRLFLTPQQKEDLVAFLKTLTDTKFINDEKFANPFK